MPGPTRRSLGVLIVFALAVGSRGSAQTQVDSATRAGLTAARAAVWRAFFQGDSAALVRLLPERMTAMESDRAQIIQDALAFARGGGTYRGMEFTHDRFFVNGATAIIWSQYIAHLADAGGNPVDRRGRAIELFVKVRDRWINPHWHLDTDR